MKKILLSLLMVVVAATSVFGVTKAYFSDNETSNGNTFTAGTLDLNVDGGNTNVVKFTVGNMRPGNQPKASYTLANVGSVNGYLDLENIVVTSNENGCGEPETEAGDTTCGNPGVGEGELADVVNLRLFVDYNGDGWISTGDKVFYNGLVKNLPTHFELDEPINAGSNVKIVALLDWWSTADDNKAQNDSMQLDMTFELAQTTGQ
jgi:spore coat-associated protein N